MWISWKQPTWQREYQVTRPCDKKGPGVFKDQQSSRTRSHGVWSAMGKRERIVGNIRGGTETRPCCVTLRTLTFTQSEKGNMWRV